MEDNAKLLLAKLNGILDDISAITEFQCSVRHQCRHLLRRLRLLAPLCEELQEFQEKVPQHTLKAFVSLMDAFIKAKGLLQFCSHGSKIYMFELVHTQFARSQEQLDTPELELFKDFFLVFNQANDLETNPAIIQRICAKLNLMSAEDLEKESIALHEMDVASGGNLGEKEKMSTLLKNLKIFFWQDMLNPAFLQKPVLLLVAMTYERACIKKWLDSGHGTCPKTQQVLSTKVLIPNHGLRSLISNWCEANGVEPPKKSGNLHPCKTSSACLVEALELVLFSASSFQVTLRINDLLQLRCINGFNLTADLVLTRGKMLQAGEIRRLSKHNSENHVCIAEAGAIPLLADLLYANDNLTQEHAVTALLNLSIYDVNKGIIVSSGAIPGILHVLKNGNMEARENAAATFFSLSSLDDYKVSIGASGAIPALVALLRTAVRAGAVPLLVTMLTQPGCEMVDEALAITAILASHPDGRIMVGILDTLPTLVDFVMNGSPLSRENAAAVLLQLCSGDPEHLSEAILLGIKDPLQDLAENGTIRGKQKAAQLLELISGFGCQHEQSSTAN
ncbi:hypothetical protein GH714_010609 [Hevea brasiliensis]|uniref:RING-type E3 ubiquitin transferase n=1 Tax=Hevea brasiliensis TaxID=3981 RepID=A0A6A6KKX7_HEVBR|nr:hypothetical protein GH714_010609 [Hevea brasiliensis]